MLRLALIVTLIGGAAMAQTADHDKALALVTPMLQELAPGAGGQVLAACVVGTATPAELATMVAAPGPSAEIGTVINAILSRPESIACIQAAAQG